MIPGFCSAYIDKDNYKHLYFFPGIDDYGKSIYNNIDIHNDDLKYDTVKYIDSSIDYKFYDKSIIKITCKMSKFNGEIDKIILNYNS